MKPTTVRAILYAVALFLTPSVEKLAPILSEGKWPTAQSLVLCLLTGTVAAVIGLRAYFDGSAERAKGNIATFSKPPGT